MFEIVNGDVANISAIHLPFQLSLHLLEEKNLLSFVVMKVTSKDTYVQMESSTR